jgi:cobalt-zinc-cadmium efflux system outer membrane protein
MNLRNIKFLLPLLFVACQPVLKDDQGGVQQLVAERSGLSCMQEECLFDEPFDAERTVYTALLVNPDVRGHLENIALSQADFVEASELKNPLFDFSFRYSNEHSYHPNIQFAIVQNIVDICLRPLRECRANAGLEQAKWEAAHEILQIAFDAEEAFYDLKAAELLHAAYLEAKIIAQAQDELAREQVKAGTISTFEARKISREAANWHEKALLGAVEVIQARKFFEMILGNPCSYKLVEDLPEPQSCDVPSCALEIALSQRLDLQAAKWKLWELKRRIPETAWWGYSQLFLGVSTEREPEGDTVTGPAIAGELPIFSYGRSAKLRAWALYRQQEAFLESLEIKVSAEVKAAEQKLALQAERAAIYRDRLNPLQKQISEDAEDYYRTMAIGATGLLEEKQQAVQTRINAIMALKEYWHAKVELKRAMGGL